MTARKCPSNRSLMMSITRNKSKKNARMVVMFSAAVVISLFTAAVCIFANSDVNARVGMEKADFGPTYKLEEIHSVEGIAMAKADAVGLYRDMGTQDSIDLNGLEDSLLKPTAELDGLNNAQVPEPATVTLLTLGGLALLRKSRRNKKN